MGGGSPPHLSGCDCLTIRSDYDVPPPKVKDPLSSKLRFELRTRGDAVATAAKMEKIAPEAGAAMAAPTPKGVLHGINVIYSYEKSRVKLACLCFALSSSVNSRFLSAVYCSLFKESWWIACIVAIV
jgi:hypothetical protein